jgi:ABC-type transporter Mla subunit MlaD
MRADATMTSRSDDRADTRADEAAQLVADMRASVEAATHRLDGLTAELNERQQLVDVLESVVDVLLDLIDPVVVVIDGDRRIIGLSRAAADQFDGAALGKPLSSVLPDAVADRLGDHIGSGAVGEIELQSDRPAARAHPLPGGGAVLVLPNP